MLDDEIIISMKRANKTWGEIAEVLGEKREKVRNYSRTKDWYDSVKKDLNNKPKLTVNSKTKLSDGSISSLVKEKLLEKRTFTEKELLELHGFNPNEFQIKTVTSNEWSMTNGEGDKYYNFQSKIIAEKISVDNYSLDKIYEIIKDIKPIEIDNVAANLELKENYLLIPLFDLHFKNGTLEEYSQQLKEIISIIKKGYKEILIIVGGDYNDVDNFNFTTVKGTQLDPVDFEQMIYEAEQFLVTICNESVKNCRNVKLTYLPGNHSSSIDFMLVRTVAKLFPQIRANVEIEEYKHDWLGNHSIFSHHGDKRKVSAKLLEVFVSLYAKEWGFSTSRYLITGHLHHETSLSNAGMTHYQVMSPSKSTTYEKKQGYITSEKGIMLFEFDNTKRKAVYYL